ncbi:MAG: hypothetical protein J6P98_06085, partial [Clostridia bacterium]|nr:hypothetical protein [Clostridia bacterium]
MKCSYCGKNNKEGALICKRCGMGLPVTPPDPEGRALFDGEFTPPQDTEATGIENPGPAAEKRSGLKKALVAACCAILVILVVIAIISIAGSGNVISSSSVPYVIGTDAVIKSGQFVNPSADAMISAKTNIDGTKVGILTGAGDLFYEPNGGDKAVARNVVSFSVSVDGKYLTYRDETGLLWSFDSAKTESAPVCICNEFVKDGYVTSPDGKSVLFRKFDDLKLYLWSGGKTQVVGEEGMTPISV